MSVLTRVGAALGGAAAALALTAAPASAGLPILGEPNDFLEQALGTKEGCDFPGLVVIVVAQVSREAVEGCGFFETDPAHPNNQG